MPLPRELETVEGDVNDISNTALPALQTAIAALPATPLEADLPDIVQIVADLKSIVDTLATATSTFISVTKRVRINQ